MSVALILFAHGSRDPAWAESVRRVQGVIRSQDPAIRVEVAFLEFLAPTLTDCAATLAGEGFDHIVVLPMFIAQGGHLMREVPEILTELRARYPAAHFELAKAIGENESVVLAMAAAGRALLAAIR